MPTIRLAVSSILALISTAGMASAAAAQDAPRATEVLEAIIVTAGKRGEHIQNLPASVFVATKERLSRTEVRNFRCVIDNWWRQGMMGGTKAHYDCIKAFSETDFTEDLKKIDVPTLIMHGDDDQIVPMADAALLSIKLLRLGTLKVYKGLGHGLCTLNADVVNADLLEFIQA